MARDNKEVRRLEEPGLRSAELDEALHEAVDGNSKRLFRFLLQVTNLRSQAPNASFARAFGNAVAAFGEDADGLVEELLAAPEDFLGGEKPQAHMQALMASVLAARILRARRARPEWEILMRLAEDYRKPVRDGVVDALTRVALEGQGGVDALVEEMQGWTDGFLQSCVALETLTQKTLLPLVPWEGAFQDRVQECLTLALDAPRSAARSQGRRTLLNVLSHALPVLVQRHPEYLEVLAPQVPSKDPAVQEMWSFVRQGMEKLGLSGHTLDALGGAESGKTQRRGGRR